jgi:hypothetical protein
MNPQLIEEINLKIKLHYLYRYSYEKIIFCSFNISLC